MAIVFCISQKIPRALGPCSLSLWLFLCLVEPDTCKEVGISLRLILGRQQTQFLTLSQPGVSCVFGGNELKALELMLG